MNHGTVLACIIVAAYAGTEVFALLKVRHRMEPTYIHRMLVETKAAVQFCDSDVAEFVDRFDRTLDRVTKKLREELVKENTENDSVGIDQEISRRERAAQSGARRSLATADGCTSQTMKDHVVRYRIYAKRSR